MSKQKEIRRMLQIPMTPDEWKHFDRVADAYVKGRYVAQAIREKMEREGGDKNAK